MAWVSRNWLGVVGSGDFAHYLAGTRVERLKTIKGAFAYAGKRYMAKKEEMPVMEQKPGRYRSKQKVESRKQINFSFPDFSFLLLQPTVVARLHGQAVLQRRVLAGMSAEIDRPFDRARQL
jgi:hypothetical protein